jgi:phosphoribosylglycinamide formyltransferase-1
VHEIVLLAGRHPWTWALANALRRRFDDFPIVLEQPQSKAALLRRRIRRLGILTVAGQLGFGLAAKVIRPFYRRQEQRIRLREDLNVSPIQDGVIRISSVNDDCAVNVLRTLRPKVIIVSQTRIIARRLLESVPAIFINIHTGITPQYRGLHGAYWALVNREPENCGVSIHIVDAGVDTGAVIAQVRIKPSPSDSYFTYHWLQLAAALPPLLSAIEDALSGRLAATAANPRTASRQYYQPTLWGYFWSALRHGVW